MFFRNFCRNKKIYQKLNLGTKIREKFSKKNLEQRLDTMFFRNFCRNKKIYQKLNLGTKIWENFLKNIYQQI
jgi:hypothetical protein